MSITDYLKKIRDNAWNTAQLGREFEKFVKKFLLTEPSFKSQFSDVWLWSECPFANGNDVGIGCNEIFLHRSRSDADDLPQIP